jgi:hypothetical protein
MWEVGLPPSPVEFSSLHRFYKLSGSWLLGSDATPAFSSRFVRDSPPPLFDAQGAPPSLLSVFFVVTAYYSVSPFPLGGGRSVQGAMLI